ncbi:MAG: HIT domain-containing protein [Magnetococcales bacterium]|nr:HIT domain-containing protein [Magnetococcales bacterium]
MQQTSLHPILAKDCIEVCDLKICKVLLMNDKQYPWLILVPDRPGLKDFDEVNSGDIAYLHADIKKASEVLRTIYKPTKLNIAALGNMVTQLHIHVIARFSNDKAWPNPVWGRHPPLPYNDEMLENVLQGLKNNFELT